MQQKSASEIASVLRQQTNWKELWFFQKTVVLYQLTVAFTLLFSPPNGGAMGRLSCRQFPTQ